MSDRTKLVLFFLCSITILFLVDTVYEGLNTLSRLSLVEAGRDQWQRPSDIIKALDLRPGNIVVDLGCGSGYFTLKLSAPVGQKGKVLAEDIRRLPLIFLWLRTLQRGEHNVDLLLGEADDPHLPKQEVNAVLIVNSYHEFTNSQVILNHVAQSLVSGGRLVVVDRGPHSLGAGSTDSEREHHQVSPEQVESELRLGGFEIISRQERFIQNDPSNDEWWLIIARKP